MRVHSRGSIRTPHTVADPLAVRDVAKAYNFPLGSYDGSGQVCGIIELGGGFRQADLDHYFGSIGLATPSVEAVPVAGGKNAPSTANSADGEVMLDIEVAGAIAPGATFRVYFCPNTDEGFLEAIKTAAAECDVISISWGGPETEWSASALAAFDAELLAARKAGVITFVAAGDSGADDGTSTPVTDFPASSPNAIACGGTRLEVSDGQRASEVTWNDNSRSSATGGGISRKFPGRQVPDVAGNADPSTGYEVRIDGQDYVIGGTSAVAPLYAGLTLLLSQALGGRLGGKIDLMNTLLTNLGVMFDVTAGDNGAYRAGPGRDQVTGLGVIDGAKLLAVLTDDIPDPAPIGGTQPTQPTPPAPPTQPTGSGADFHVSDAVAARVAAAAERAGETGDEWVEHRLEKYFHLSD